MLAFNLSAELVFTNLLNLVDLAGVAVRASDRTGADPIVVAGGDCAFNPEPLADFVDCFVLGDGEEAVGEINQVLAGSPPPNDPAVAPPGRRCSVRWPACPGSTSRPATRWPTSPCR